MNEYDEKESAISFPATLGNGIRFSVLFGLVVGLSACEQPIPKTAQYQDDPGEVTITAPTDASAAPPVVSPDAQQRSTTDAFSGWIEYSDTATGLSFRYPGDWFLYPAKPGGVSTTIVANYDLNKVEQEQGEYAPKQIKIDITLAPYPTEREENPLEWAATNLIHPSAISREVSSHDLGGSKGLRVDYVIFDNARTSIFFGHPDGMIILRAYGGATAMNTVLTDFLSTLAVLDPRTE